MYGSDYYGSDYYSSLYYGALRGDPDALAAFDRLSLRDVQYEALKLTVTGTGVDTHSMEKEYWLGVLGGSSRMSTRDIKYEGIILGLGYSSYKDYFDTQTSNVWPDHNSSEKAYWLKIIADNL